MKTIIPIVAAFTVALPLSLIAQKASPSVPSETTIRLAQTTTEVGSTASAGGVGNNQYPRVAVQQNRSANAAGGYGGGYGTGYAYRLQNLVSRFPGTAEAPLVIRSSEMNAKDQASLEEDLAVMAHILRKALEDLPSGPAHTRTAMGIDLFVTPNAGTMRSIYLEGYGALFVLQVGFPVVAPATSAKEEKPTGDSTWEEARQELYGQSAESQIPTAPTEEYSEEKVTRLKETLLRALKNAANIRTLAGDITVCVLGGSASGLPANTAALYKHSGAARAGAVGQLLVASNEPAAAQGTVLTIKVAKADVDAFAKGELKFSDFQQHARISAYTVAAANSSGVDALLGGGGGVGR